MLTCTICNLPKHYKCEGLSKAIASEILQHNNESYHWACHGCFILPTYNYIDDPRPTYFNHPKSLMLCDPVCKICLNSCSSFLNNYAKCIWCDKICHKKCINGQLGCLPCCIELIPGFQCNSNILFDQQISLKSEMYDPYDRSSLINQIGDKISSEEESSVWSY